jgi:hypothetical protein
MDLFDLLFLALALTTVVLVARIGWLAVRGARGKASRLARRLAIGIVAYLGIVVVVSLFSHRREYHVGDMQCFDDWCITVSGADRPDGSDQLTVDLTLTNRSRGTPMGERGTVVYVVDDGGHRYDPLPDPAERAFADHVPPGQSVTTTRHFAVPRGARKLGLIYTHEDGFPIGWLVIGESGWFQPPPIVYLE